MIPNLQDLPYVQRPRKLNLPALNYRAMRGDMIQVCRILPGTGHIDSNVFFSFLTSTMTGWSQQQIPVNDVITVSVTGRWKAATGFPNAMCLPKGWIVLIPGPTGFEDNKNADCPNRFLKKLRTEGWECQQTTPVCVYTCCACAQVMCVLRNCSYRADTT